MPRGIGKSNLAEAFKTVAQAMQEQVRLYERVNKSIASAWVEAYDRENALKRDINDKNYTKFTTPDWRKRR